MGEQLRELRRLNNVPLHVAENIISQRLHDLIDVEEHHIYRVALEGSHGILNEVRMVAVGW